MEWLLESSAEFRLKKSLSIQGRIPDRLFLEYHEDLLKKCKLKNYDQRGGKQLDDLELLADLQHHGAATCLLDFTRNALVALWFACEKSDAGGKVFVVNTADAETFLEITHTDIENKSISDILEFKTRETDKDQAAGSPTPETLAASPNKPNFWNWIPAHLNERITAQHSLFLFGLPSSGKLRSEKLIIESASKEQIRRELEELHDICEEFLFPDFVGFAYIQRSNAPYPTPDAKEYLRRGAEALQRGQYSEAIEDFTKAIELEPDADTYYIRGRAYGRQREYDRAIQDFTKTTELNPEFADAYYARGNAYGRQGEHDRAIQESTKAIELNPEFANAYYIRGNAYGRQGEHDRAIQDFTKAIELNPEFADAYYIRGLAYGRQGEHDRAIQDFTKTIELNPKFADAYYIRGLAYGRQGEHDRAIQDFTKAIELNPEFADAYYDRGLAYGRQGEHDRATQDFTKAIELNPEFANAHYARGLAYSRQGEHDRATQDFTKAIELNPEFANAHYARGLAYGRQGEHDRATQDFTKTIELNPDDAKTYYARGLARLHLQRWQEAQSDLTAAKDAGLDIVALFRRDNSSVADFGWNFGITLPEDIAAMLTENKN